MNETTTVVDENGDPPTVTNYLISIVATGEPVTTYAVGIQFGRAVEALGIAPESAQVYITPIAVNPTQVSLRDVWGNDNRAETKRYLSNEWPELANALNVICGLGGRHEENPEPAP